MRKNWSEGVFLPRVREGDVKITAATRTHVFHLSRCAEQVLFLDFELNNIYEAIKMKIKSI